jgi:hypothetical protein
MLTKGKLRAGWHAPITGAKPKLLQKRGELCLSGRITDCARRNNRGNQKHCQFTFAHGDPFAVFSATLLLERGEVHKRISPFSYFEYRGA